MINPVKSFLTHGPLKRTGRTCCWTIQTHSDEVKTEPDVERSMNLTH